jgi:hypothetical protein
MIPIPHSSYFTEPYRGELSIRMMTDIAYGWASRNMLVGDIHFLTFPENRDTLLTNHYTSGLLIKRNETDCDFEWIGSSGTEILLSKDTF